MIQLLYDLSIRLYWAGINLASLWHPKAKKWTQGRRHWRRTMKKELQGVDQPFWVHAASLGEMEQGLPVIQKVRSEHPQVPIVITFFSPSGFEHFQETDSVDHKFYLPLDSRRSVRDFLDILQPRAALFIKYEVWVNFFKALHRRDIPIILAPALFRPTQWYFRGWLWPFFLRIFKGVDVLLVQNKKSTELLADKGLPNVEVCGDPRFDRAYAIRKSDYDQQDKMTAFLNDQFCLVAGSSWKPEESLLQTLCEERSDFKLILAPHQVDEDNVARLTDQFQKFGISRYSDKNWQKKDRILLVDTIGDLKKLYRFGHLALVGGGFGPGVHSTVEAIVYEIPVGFGPNYHKFVETKEMIERKIGFEIRNQKDLSALMERLCGQPEKQQKEAQRIKEYLEEKRGAVDRIYGKIKPLLSE